MLIALPFPDQPGSHEERVKGVCSIGGPHFGLGLAIGSAAGMSR
jgi:hypothetical protein